MRLMCTVQAFTEALNDGNILSMGAVSSPSCQEQSLCVLEGGDTQSGLSVPTATDLGSAVAR